MPEPHKLIYALIRRGLLLAFARTSQAHLFLIRRGGCYWHLPEPHKLIYFLIKRGLLFAFGGDYFLCSFLFCKELVEGIEGGAGGFFAQHDHFGGDAEGNFVGCFGAEV